MRHARFPRDRRALTTLPSIIIALLAGATAGAQSPAVKILPDAFDAIFPNSSTTHG